MAKKNSLSIIDDGVSVEGNIEFVGELLIRGRLSGKVTGATVTIAEEGRVRADMKIERMTVGGVFDGEVRAEDELNILPGGQCRGKVICKSLVVQAGGILNADVSQLGNPGVYRQKKISAPVKKVIDL
ncbi:MAG: polymer-forming cytoskeletal protein [Desulfobacterales bacterium]|nr:polymer-forming cytoskeletal protein [Desulfobacterales bacterium]